MKQTDRYRLMNEAGASEQEIRKAFDTPQEMTVFSWTIMVAKSSDVLLPLLQHIVACAS